MGVTGLWKLIECSGRPVPIETLENKVLAVDISIWLHQVVKGYQDNKGGHVHNAHIVGLFQRLCKLLYFRIKPVFVFDGQACRLKRETIHKRSLQKSKIQSEAERIEKLLLESLAKEHVLKEKLQECALKSPVKKLKAVSDNKDDMFALPPTDDVKLETIKSELAKNEEVEEEEWSCPKKSYNRNITSIDVNSSYFKSLPADKRHDILVDIKETRKQSSWGQMRNLPVESDDFSKFQMQGLLKRRHVQVSLEAAEKEMGGKNWSLSELESLLTEDGVIESSKKHAQKIAADENVRFLLVRDIAKAISDAKAPKSEEPQPSTSKQALKQEEEENLDDEYDLELQKAIQLSLGHDIDNDNVDEEEKPAESEDGPVKLNAQQRRKFANTVHSHGLVRGFMMEYGEMNDDNLQDLVNETQVETKGDELNDSWSQKFPNTDRYVLYGTQAEEKPTEKSEAETEPKEIVITVDSQIAKFEEKDDLFADVFGVEKEKIDLTESDAEDENEIAPDVEVASISSSDDDTVEYDIPEALKAADEEKVLESDSGFVSEEGKSKLPAQEDSVQPSSENEKFWTLLDDEPEAPEQAPEKNEPAEEVIEVKAPIVPEIEKSESDKFWSQLQEQEEHKAAAAEKTPVKIAPIFEPSPKKVTPLKIDSELTTEDKKEVESAVKALEQDFTEEELKKLQRDVVQETKDFEHERNKLNRMGMSISESMVRDCKDLLKLFGIPFIKSPTEAEAQCAFLNNIEMIDGVITDDSDVWLFGAKTVYKNFFVQKKNVMEFRMDSVQEMFHLDRNKLIQLAMLVGSDYTLGLNGVGAVTALEILAAFPSTPESEGETDRYQSLLSSLRKFRDWLRNGKEAGVAGKTVLKSKLKNVEIIKGFPSIEVMRAYLEPSIDTSTEPFSWGTPDSESLVEYTKVKLGWTRLKTEEILKPVLKRLNEKKQTTIRDYFKSQMAMKVFDNQKMSKRVQKAVGRIGGDEPEPEQKEKKKPRKRKAETKAAKKKREAEEEKEIKEIEGLVMLSDDDDDDGDMMPPPAKKLTPSPEKVNAFSMLKQPEPAKEKPVARKRKTKSDDPQPSTSKAADDDILPPKRAPRIPDTKQVIPQRERDKEEQEKNKQKAIEIFKKTRSSKKK